MFTKLTSFCGKIWQTLRQRLGRRLPRRQVALEAPVDGKTMALLHTLQEFSETVIREIMVPRTDMVVASVTSSMVELQTLVREVGHSRIPIFADNIDNIVGILHVKDLVGCVAGEFDLVKLMRPTFYVPEVMRISELLREFQRRKTHLAIVVDEYGGTAGVVSLEDIIEELVGEIQDEYDDDELELRTINDKLVAKGSINLWTLEEALGSHLPRHGDYETLAGFLTAQKGSLPPPGWVYVHGALRFTVKEAGERRIEVVEIERIVGNVR